MAQLQPNEISSIKIDSLPEPDIMISVLIITYNHKNYIGQAIDSVISQKVDFKIEIIIGDDCSTDGTREVIIDYQTRYPQTIKPILHPTKNEGLPGKLNFLSTLKEAKGKYIALLDGDDYWNDPSKLEKQISLLEANPDYSICFHRVYEQEPGKPLVLSSLNNPDTEATYTIFDLAKYNMMHTPSVVYRRDATGELPAWFIDSHVGDYVIHLLNARKGKIKYIPDPMAVYRKHIGTWSSLSQFKMWERWLSVLDLLIADFKEHEVSDVLKDQRENIVAQVIEAAKRREMQYEALLTSPKEIATRIAFRKLLAAIGYRMGLRSKKGAE